MMGWLAGPSKGLLMVGRENGYLPPVLQKTNKKDIQVNILIGQGIIVSAVALLFAFIPSVSSAFWILSAMTTQIYLIMYVLMFIAVVRLRRSQPDHPRGYRVPALMALAGIGLVSSVLVFFIGLIPPSQFGAGSVIALLGYRGRRGAPRAGGAFLFLRMRKPSWKERGAGSRHSSERREGVMTVQEKMTHLGRTSPSSSAIVALMVAGVATYRTARTARRHTPRPQNSSASCSAAGLKSPDEAEAVSTVRHRWRRGGAEPRRALLRGAVRDAARQCRPAARRSSSTPISYGAPRPLLAVYAPTSSSSSRRPSTD